MALMMLKTKIYRQSFILICVLQLVSGLTTVAAASQTNVLNGIDVLAARKFDVLHGKRVGLITNQTGRSGDGRSSIDLISNAPGVRLVAVFSPEHGVRGILDEKYASHNDEVTGLRVYSLYGATCRPLPEMLQGIDVLVFDIQDIGTRFYTYIGTLSLAMRAAKDSGVAFVVLDRPNPIGGLIVSGAIPKARPKDKGSGCGMLTSIHPIPTRHGMTVGELAQLFNSEFDIGCNLTIIKMQNWQRSMYFDETGQTWVNPSPNMTSLAAAILYPGFGLMESTNLSVGRGTDQPFLVYGAPWVNNKAVIAKLSAHDIKGIKFSPCTFVPSGSYPYAGKVCHGVRITITNRNELDPIEAGMHLVKSFAETHPGSFRPYDGFATEAGDADTWNILIRQQKKPREMTERWAGDLGKFKELRGKYLLYEP